MTRCTLLASLLLSSSLLAGCSMQMVAEQWDAWVAAHNACETVDDCAVVYPGCPLGCFEAVSASDAAAARAEADRLIALYEAPGRSCAYDCIEEPPLVCESMVCGFAE